MAATFCAEPEAIFLPKFENANAKARELYASLDREGGRVFVASVKSSGSLWIATSRDGKLVSTSKNGAGNVYSIAGHYALVHRLHSEFGEAGWRAAYASLLDHLERSGISLGCELVTKCLGDHASHPKTDHLVVNAVLDRSTMQPCPPSALLHLQDKYRLLIPGMYIFEKAQDFLGVFDQYRHETDATWDQVDHAMSSVASHTVPMPYSLLHSQILEGFVCYMMKRPSSWPANHQLGLPSGESMPSISTIFYDECAKSLDSLHRSLEASLVSIGVPPRILTPSPIDPVLASAKEARQGIGSDDWWSMCKALEDLAIPHSIKAWREGDAKSWLACVHVVMDWGFARYEKERTSRALRGNGGSNGNAAILPPLLRGNAWRLSISGEGDALPSPMSVDGSPRPSKAQRGGNDSPMAWSGSSSGECGGGGGAEAGTVWKFKLLSYMRRTFLCRNCSGDLAATGNVAAYHKRLASVVSNWELPPEVRAKVLSWARAWGRHILSLSDEDRKAISKGCYIDALETWISGGEVARWSDSEMAPGLVLVVEGGGSGKQLADEVARGMGVAVRGSKDAGLDEAALRCMSEVGGVIKGEVACGGMQKLVKMLHRLPLKSVRVVVALVDVTHDKCLAALGPDPKARDVKKVQGMCSGILNRVRERQGVSGLIVLELEEGREGAFGMIEAELAARGASTGGREGEDYGLVDASVRAPPLIVALFVTTVGWGKNSVCSELEAQGLFQSLVPEGEGGGGRYKVLEGDAMPQTFWKEIGREAADPCLSLLVLNRNFPPNSWTKCLSQLDSACTSAGRGASIVAILPRSEGTEFSPYTLTDFAVCLMGVQSRSNHGSGLDSTNASTASITRLFFNTYRGVGFRGLLDQVREGLTPNVAVVSWLRDGCHESAPPELCEAMRHVMTSRGDDEEKASRIAISEHSRFLDSCRLPLHAVAQDLARSLRLAIQDAPPPSVVGVPLPQGAAGPATAKYIGVVLDKEGGQRLAEAVTCCLPPGGAGDAVRAAPMRERYHVTLWHGQAHGPLPPSLEALEGTTCTVQPIYVAWDATCVCCAVRLGEPLTESSLNEIAHVTVWTADGTPNKYSNELLRAAQGAEGLVEVRNVEDDGMVPACVGTVSLVW